MRQKSMFVAFIAGLVTVMVNVDATAGEQRKPVRMAISKTFIPDQPRIFVNIALDEFKDVMKQTSGLTGDVQAEDGPLEIAKKLDDQQLDLAILYAHEFAWAKKTHPELRPFLIAATKKQEKRAHLVVHKTSAAKSLADLRGQKLDLPRGTKAYCRIYLEKLCNDTVKKTSEEHFGTVAKSATPTSALDEVARETAQATVIDSISLDFYKDVKGPFFANHLRVLQESAIVPPAVIVYKPDTLDAETLGRLRDGFRKAHATTRGRTLMSLWHIDAFEPVPAEYAKALTEVLREYPVPASPR